MTDEPVVKASAGWLLEHGLWIEACNLTGLGEWAVNEGQMGRDEQVTLTFAQAESIGLLRVAGREARREADSRPVIVRAVQLSSMSPAQWDAWDAWDDDGAYWHLRYRTGQGTARQEGEAGSSEPGQVLSFRHGDPLDGSISLEEFCEHAGLRLELEE